MANLFGLSKPNTNLKKNVFDLSEKTLFSLSAGMLLPCLTRELNPGEKVKFNLSSFTRTQPLNTAAFVRCRQYYHLFFVPYRQLWSGWDNFINGVDYKTSALQSGKSYTQVPGIPLFDFIERMIKDGTLLQHFVSTPGGKSRKIAYDEHGYDYFLGISRVLEMLGYGFQLPITKAQLTKLGFENYPIGEVKTLAEFFSVYAGAYLSVVRKQKLQNRDNPNVMAGSETAESRRRREWQLLHAEWYDPEPPSEILNPSNEDKRKLLSLLDEIFPALRTIKVNPFRLLAYQKIYSDFYKRDDYEATRPEHFNIDDYAGATVSLSDTDRMLGMLRMRYRWLPKDYFTGIVPSELFGVSTAFMQELSADKVGTSNALTADGEKVSIHNASVSTKSIRAAFAIEKLLRLTRRAGGQDYLSQTAAHYGFEPPKGRGDKVEFLGGYATNININDVLTTAETVQGSTGQVRGQGIGSTSDNKPIEFTAKEHGLIMCITSVVPESDYEGVGLDSFNAKFKRGDYFHPEFQDLGLQPVFGYELRNDYDTESSRGRTSVLGYVPRYSEYKTAYDKVHGSFMNGRSLSAWSSIASFNYDKKGTGALINTLKVSPRVLDSIMTTYFDGREINDQFYNQVHFDVKVIRPMSITGQKL